VSTWYTGGAGYGALAISTHLQGFSSCVAHSINTASINVPAGHGYSGFGGGGGFSGGFGGGGFSGGGGGGGGGGSW